MTMGPILGGLLLSLVFTGATFSADAASRWKADFETADGQKVQNLFTLQIDGEKLTGTVHSSVSGTDAKIEEGKIKGDEIGFAITRNFGGNDVRLLQRQGRRRRDQVRRDGWRGW